MSIHRALALAIAAALGLAACAPLPAPPSPPPSGPAAPPAARPPLDERSAARNFVEVVARVEPVAERECRQRAPRVDCDFLIVIDDRPGVAANAFQTVDARGRPIIAFTLPLIADARNRDELAFVLAHEAAHHIAGHLDQQRRNATAGAAIFGELAGALGARDPRDIRSAQQIGATVGVRAYAKGFELEADRLGAIITARAGYDPLRGAEFFFRIPDPGDAFLATHPPNADRIETVRRAVAGL